MSITKADIKEVEIKYAKSVIDRYKGCRPRDVRQWMWRAATAHDAMSKKWFGGKTTVTQKIVVDANTLPELQKLGTLASSMDGAEAPLGSYFDRMVSRIRNILPDYFDAYGLTPDDIRGITVPKFKNMGTSTHILGYYDRTKKDRVSRMYLANDIAAYFRALKDYSIGPDHFGTYYTTLSVDPLAFFSLGSFGCDSDSCFGAKGDRACRYFLGLVRESFVFLVSENPIKTFNEGSCSRRALIRSICLLNTNGKHRHVLSTNTYHRTIPQGLTDALWAKAMCDAFSIQEPHFYDYSDYDIPGMTDDEDAFYSNGDAIVLSSDKDWRDNEREDSYKNAQIKATPFRFDLDDFVFPYDDDNNY